MPCSNVCGKFEVQAQLFQSHTNPTKLLGSMSVEGQLRFRRSGAIEMRLLSRLCRYRLHRTYLFSTPIAP